VHGDSGRAVFDTLWFCPVSNSWAMALRVELQAGFHFFLQKHPMDRPSPLGIDTKANNKFPAA
jgi:hypothetical protein